MELEDEEKRREKRAQMAAKTHAKQAARDPLSPTIAAQSTGAMDALLDKLRAAGPTKREARRRARLRQNGAVRAASITKDAETGESIEKSDEPSAVSSDLEKTPMSPDITVTAAEQTAEEDSLTKRTEEMLMRLRDGVDPSTSLDKGSMRDKRKERRRRNGSNVPSTTTEPVVLSLATSPSMTSTLLPSIPLSPGGMGGLSPEGEDQVARAKSALMAMRRGSDTGSIGSMTSEIQPTAMEPEVSASSSVAVIDDEEGGDTPTTVVSPPSPEPEVILGV